MTPEVGKWYQDRTPGEPMYPGDLLVPGAFYKVLGVAAETLRVIDLDGNDRIVNRLMFESQMTPATRVPMLRREP